MNDIANIFNQVLAIVERCCANGSDFLLTDIGLLCISKIESFYIQTREFDDE